MRTCACAYLCAVCEHVRLLMCTRVCVHAVCVRVRLLMCMHVCTVSVCVCMRACERACVRACVRASVHVFVLATVLQMCCACSVHILLLFSVVMLVSATMLRCPRSCMAASLWWRSSPSTSPFLRSANSSTGQHAVLLIHACVSCSEPYSTFTYLYLQ